MSQLSQPPPPPPPWPTTAPSPIALPSPSRPQPLPPKLDRGSRDGGIIGVQCSLAAAASPSHGDSGAAGDSAAAQGRQGAERAATAVWRETVWAQTWGRQAAARAEEAKRREEVSVQTFRGRRRAKKKNGIYPKGSPAQLGNPRQRHERPDTRCEGRDTQVVGRHAPGLVTRWARHIRGGTAMRAGPPLSTCGGRETRALTYIP